MDYKPLVLRKLFRRRVIGGKHTAFENVMSGIPGHATGDVKKAAEELIKSPRIKRPTFPFEPLIKSKS